MVKLGILGSGGITACHFSAIDRLEDVTVGAIASVDEASGKAAAEKYGAALYKDYKELLDSEKALDGIVVALPNFMHYEACVYAINAGHKHIMCEKPLGIHAEESRKLVELVKENGVMLQSAYMKRFNPGFEKIKELMPHIGEAEFITSEIIFSGLDPEEQRKLPVPPGWNGNAKLAGGGILVNCGSHHIDLLNYLFGEMKSVSCKVKYIREGEDYLVDGCFTTKSGLDIAMKLGRSELPTVSPNWKPYRKPCWNEFIEVIGTKGYIKVDNPSWQGFDPISVTYWLKDMPGPEALAFNCGDQWSNEFAAFSQSCKTGKLNDKASTVADGYRADFIIEKMRESGNLNGLPVELNFAY